MKFLRNLSDFTSILCYHLFSIHWAIFDWFPIHWILIIRIIANLCSSISMIIHLNWMDALLLCSFHSFIRVNFSRDKLSKCFYWENYEWLSMKWQWSYLLTSVSSNSTEIEIAVEFFPPMKTQSRLIFMEFACLFKMKFITEISKNQKRPGNSPRWKWVDCQCVFLQQQKLT